VLVSSGDCRCVSHEWSLSENGFHRSLTPLITNDDFLTPDRHQRGVIWALGFYP
jgi:hypothetical protein